MRDAAQVRVARRQGAQLRLHRLHIRAGQQFEAQYRQLLAKLADADQRGAAHAGHGVEHRLGLFGVQRAGGGFHALGLAPAEPQPALLVEPADIAHAVHDALAAVVLHFADLGRGRGLRAVVVAVGGGGAGHGDLADLARRQLAHAAPFRDRCVVDGDDAHHVRRHHAAHAGTGAGLGGCAGVLQFTAFDHRHRQAFGGAVGRPELRVLGQQFTHFGHGLRRHRRAGRGHPAQRRQRLAVLGQHPHQGRRAEQLGHAEAGDGIVQLARVGTAGPGRIHVRDHAGQAQRRVKQGERREGRQIHATGLHAEGIAQQLDLADEVAVAVDHALGYAGGAAGEQDRGHVIRRGVRQLRAGTGTGRLDLGQAGAAPAPTRADGDQPRGRLRPAQQQPRHMRQRDADEGLRLRLVQALLQCALVDARIHQHRHRAELEQGEHQQEKLRPRPHHHHGAHAAADAMGLQSGGDGVAARIQAAVIEGHVVGGHAAGTGPAGAADGDLVGPLARQLRQARGDIAGFVHFHIVAAEENSCASPARVENFPSPTSQSPPEGRHPCIPA